MKVFISYRRDDTGGRAGRLFDLLAARYGAGRVFQDVSAVAPGTYFDEQVDAAIAGSDVVLVVIGQRWLSSTSGDGARRIDRDDDYVRHEVRAALGSDVRVVPVLVDGAELPTTTELPDDLVPLVRRQAVSVRDDSWHRDVDDLINRLETEPADNVVSPHSRRRRTAFAVGVGAIVVIALIVAALVLRDQDEGGSEDGGDDGELPSCETADASWSAATIEESTVELQIDGYDLRLEPRSASSRPDGDGYFVQVELAVANIGTPEPGTSDDDIYLTDDHVAGLMVDGVETSDIRCLSAVGDQQVAPGQVVLITWGWASVIDPVGAELVVVMDPEGNVPIGVG